MKNETPVVTVSSASYLRLIPFLIIVALMAFCPTLMRADTIALSFAPLGPTANAPFLTVGYAFTLSSPILVTQIGIWDPENDGLLGSSVVTIWTSTGTQEAQGTVPSGTGATLTDGFRYVSIAPILLPAGTYTIGSFSGDSGDVFRENASAITTASGVTYDGSRSTFFNAFPPGNILLAANGYFGPNFQFTAATTTPDTGTTASLFALSLTGLAFLRRKLC